MTAHVALSEEECYLHVLLSDPSGLDQAEFTWVASENDDLCFRAWPFQWAWWKNTDPKQIDQNARSTGKSLSIKVRLCAFPFVHPNQESLITAPELNHLDPIVKLIETQVERTRLTREMLRKPPTHRPFYMEFRNGARILGAIPQKTGVGVKGKHPVWLEQDESCFVAGTFILTRRGLRPIESVEVGEYVFTHRNRWRRVLGRASTERATVTMKGAGCRGVGVTANHRFWVKDVQERDWLKRAGPRRFTPGGWMKASEMVGAHWSSPTSFPDAEIPKCLPCSSRESDHDTSTDAFAWILGLYLAEGSVSSSIGSGCTLNRTWFSIHRDEVPEVTRRLTAAGLHSRVDFFPDSKGANVSVTSQSLARWIKAEMPGDCHNKQVPAWVLGTSRGYRQAVLDGLLYGDGSETTDVRYLRGRRRLSTTSPAQAISARLLGGTLGYHTSLYWSPAPKKRTSIRGRSFQGGESYEVIFALSGFSHFDDGKMFTKVKSLMQRSVAETVYDLEVEDDHSFVADGLVVHNSDYPEPGWTELIETVNKTDANAVWRSHGVTRGVRDSFYRNSFHADAELPLRPVSHKAEGKWTVQKIPAMARPSWSDEERTEKILEYGSRDDPDYRRNVLGAHGDAQSPLFVISRLMRCVDDDPSSSYNTDEYWQMSIKDSELDASGDSIIDFIDPPSTHAKYKTVWMGADIGMTIDPTEILIAGETPLTAEERRDQSKSKAVPVLGTSRLKIIGRVTLKRISEPDQADAIIALIDHYRPEVFAMDSTGIGLPLFQNIQRRMMDVADTLRSSRARKAAECIKGYNFSSKILVDFDETADLDEDITLDERVKEAGIQRLVIEFSTDCLRSYVDEGRLWMPWDKELIGEFQGQTFSYSKAQTDSYGRRRIFSTGKFHALDAARMLVLGHKQHSIEALMATKEDETAPVVDVFMPYDSFGGGASGSAW